MFEGSRNVNAQFLQPLQQILQEAFELIGRVTRPEVCGRQSLQKPLGTRERNTALTNEPPQRVRQRFQDRIGNEVTWHPHRMSAR